MKILFLSGYVMNFAETEYPWWFRILRKRKINDIYLGATYGGWVESLMKGLMNSSDIVMGISFPSNNLNLPKDNLVKHYPIQMTLKDKFKIKLLNKVGLCKTASVLYESKILNNYLNIIKDFEPDIIHVWGCEFPMGLVVKYTNIPVVVHIQGILNPYKDAFFPPGINFFSLFKHGYFKEAWKMRKSYLMRRDHDLIRENTICQNVKYFIGRTEWDKNIISILAPQAKYFHGGEMLRPQIVMSEKWHYHNRKHLILVSTIRNALYKGQDVILRSALLLKKIYGNDFEWRIFGVTGINVFESITGIDALKVNVKCYGVVDVKTLIGSLLECDVYIHESYIENSPNSVCEAQYLGVPVIATDGGGTSSMLKNNSGILIPTNDAYQTAAYIVKLKENKQLSEKYSHNAITSAEKRHNSQSIIDQLIDTYYSILQES